MVKRNKFEVIRDILISIKSKRGKIKPTHILYKSNLSHEMMMKYLKELLDNKLIIEREKDNHKTYSITTKGEEYLNKYNSMIKFMESFGLNDGK